MYQQFFSRVADRRTLRLGVDDDGSAISKSRRPVDEDMAVPCSGLDHRHRGIFRDERDEACAAARNDHVHESASLDQFVNGLPAARIEQLDCTFGNTRNRSHDLNQALIAASRLFASAQNDGIPRLQREDGRINRYVRTRFVNDPDNAERHTQLANAQAVRLRPFGENFADRVG